MSRHLAWHPAQALHRVFVQPYFQDRSSQLLQLGLRCTPRITATQQERRYASKFRPKNRAPTKRVVQKYKFNGEIKARQIQIVDSETGKLQEPVYTGDVLASLDLTTHRLVQVASVEHKDLGLIPTCKIEDTRALYNLSKQRKEERKEADQARDRETSVKKLELNWAIDANDLSHRLIKLKDFLDQGRKVEILLAPKKRGRVASPEECQDVIAKIRSTVDEVPGARETKSIEGMIGKVAMLSFKGRPQLINGPTKPEELAVDG